MDLLAVLFLRSNLVSDWAELILEIIHLPNKIFLFDCSLLIAEEELSKVTASIIGKSRAVIELGKKFYYSQIQSDMHTAYR